MSHYIVELEAGVWIAPWHGDPGRTLDRRHATQFASEELADESLNDARKFRAFDDAIVMEVKAGEA